MFELFVMSLREYWGESEDGSRDVQGSIDELQSVLTSHYGKDVSWDEPELDPAKKDEEISVDVIDDVQIASLHAVAAKLELDGNLDGLEFDPESPWECEVFDRLDEELNDEAEERDVEKFCHLLSIGNSFECVCVPVDLPFVAQINVDDEEGADDEDDEEEEDHKCCCCGDDDCCCEEDDNSIDVASTIAIRRELDEIAKALKLDTNLNIDSDDVSFADDDPYRCAKIAWYILSAKVDDAIAAKQPLIIRFSEDDYEDIEDEDDGE